MPAAVATMTSPVKSRGATAAGGSPARQTVVNVYLLVAGPDGEDGPIAIAIPNSYLWREALKALANVGLNGQMIGECKFLKNLPLSIFFRGVNNGVFLEQFPDQLANAWFLCDSMAAMNGSANGYENFNDLAAKIAHGITTTTGSKPLPRLLLLLICRLTSSLCCCFGVSVSFVGVVKTLKLNDESVGRLYTAVKAKESASDNDGAVRQTLAEACVVDKSRWDHV